MAGRPPGARNKRNRALDEAAALAAERLAAAIPDAFTGDAHALLMAVYKDPALDLALRVDAAKAAIRFEKPALAATTLSGDEAAPIQVRVSIADA